MRIVTKFAKIAMPTECKKLIFLNSIFQGGRLFVGAVCALYFFSFGLQAQDYALIKSVQAAVFLGLDIPLGYLMGKIGESRSLMLALCCGAMGALACMLVTNFWGFAVSEVFFALSISIWPVAFSSYAMKILENIKIEGAVEKFFHFGDSLTNLTTLICGAIGGVLFGLNKYLPYGLFFVVYTLLLLISYFYLVNMHAPSNKKDVVDLTVSNLKGALSVFPYATIIFLLQIFLQPLLHYWQPLFTEKFDSTPKEMSIIFISYSLAMSGISLVYSRLTRFSGVRSDFFVLAIALVGSLAYALIPYLNSYVVSTALFSLTFGILNLAQISSGVLVQNNLRDMNRMIITKYVSVYARLGMVISIIAIHFLFSSGHEIGALYKIYGISACLIFFVYLGVIKTRKSMEKTYVS